MVTLDRVMAEFNRPILVNEHSCWLWMGSTDPRGYARIGGRLVYQITCRWAGKICSDQTELCHTCPNHNCINPDHFYVGTHKQNMNDENRNSMGPKGRVTEAQIESINAMLKVGVPKGVIAHLHGISPQWVSRFIRKEFKYAKPC